MWSHVQCLLAFLKIAMAATGWAGDRDSRNFQVEDRGGAELSEVKHDAKFLKYISATEKTGTTGLCKSLLSYWNLLGRLALPFFSASINYCHHSTHYSCSAISCCPLPSMSQSLPSPGLCCYFPLPRREYANPGISRFGKKLEGQIWLLSHTISVTELDRKPQKHKLQPCVA